jgi:biopolymer transport protein ExbD
MNSKVPRRLSLLETKARKLRLKGQRAEASAEINVTPLVDVVLVLLIIFMLVLPKLNEVIKLPLAARPEKLASSSSDSLNVGLKLDGNISLNGRKVDSGQLSDAIAKEMKKMPSRSVYLSADTGLTFKSVRAILQALQDAGVGKAGLMATRIPEEE